MSTHIKAKKKFVQVVIALVVICMTAAGGGYLLGDLFVNDAQAAYTASVGTASEWTAAVNNLTSGDIIINLRSDLNAGGKLTAINNNRHVTVNMNGHTIYWDRQDHETGSTIMSTSYTSGDYADGKYWGLITVNSGSLTLAGKGEVRLKQITTGMKDNSGRGDYVQRLAAIVNKGTVNIGSQVTVSGYCSNVDQGNNYKDSFIYCMGIYNDGGTVNTSGTINSGSMVAGYSGGTNSFHYAICYGIYGGTVNADGGAINVDAYSGGYGSSMTCKESNHMIEVAVGIYSNSAKVLGNTNISCDTITWQDKDGHDNWSSGGYNIMVSTGVMYTKGTNNYPVLGPGVNITSTYNMHNNERIMPPGSTNDAQAYTNLHCEDNGPYNYGRYAQAVTGVEFNEHTNGMDTSEHVMDNNKRGFFGNLTYVSNDGGYKYGFDGWESYYRTEESYEKYKSSTDKNAYLVDASSCNQEATARKQVGTQTSYFRNGTPGDQGGGQFVTVYRFYNDSVNANNLYDVKFDMDSDILSNRAYMNVGGATNYRGYISDNSSLVSRGGGGAIRNGNYYQYHNTTVEKPKTTAYAVRNKSVGTADFKLTDWNAVGSELSGSGTSLGSSDQTMVIYVNYIKKSPTVPRAVAANKDGFIDKNSTSKAFTVEYTGAALVPDTDFKLEIFDMGSDLTESSNNPDDDTQVTDQYNVTGGGAGISVSYRYTSNYNEAQPNWSDGLPKDAGQYKIEITLAADTTYSATCKNRLDAKELIDCTITKANVEVETDKQTVRQTYGSTLAEMITLADYKVNGKNGEKPSGTWTFQNNDSNAYLDANPSSGYSINLKWTPAPGSASAKNYADTDYTVTLYIDKRNVTVNAGHSSIGYGQLPSEVDWQYDYENLADCDIEKSKEWDKNSKTQIQVQGAWTDYSETTEKGTYPAQIAEFGGESDQNNTFTKNTANGQLIVDKRPIIYTAVAESRAYIPGNSTVSVTLTYKSGATAEDQMKVVQQFTVEGTMTSPDAGANKVVAIDMTKLTDAQTGLDMNNYTASLDERCLVLITKADPTGIDCTAQTPITYDSTKTLNDYPLTTAGDGAVAGSWSWQNAEIVPTCDVSEYTAVFTPTDGRNYNNATKKVAIEVQQKEVKISVSELTIQYGDTIPNILGSINYDGWTGSDNINNIATEGNLTTQVVNAGGSNYNRGMPAGDYTIRLISTYTAVNYKFTTENGTLHVNKRPLTLTVRDKTITYYDNRPDYTTDDIIAEGFYTTSQNLNVLSGAPNFTIGYHVGDGAGDYQVTLDGYTSNNYEITFNPGTIHVQKATLTVKPNALTVGYGSQAPKYMPAEDGTKQYTIIGFKGQDNESNSEITGEPIFVVRNYISGSKIGTYPVSVDTSEMSAKNYVFEGDESVLLTIVKATPDIATPPSATIVHSQRYSEAIFTDDYVVNNPNNDALPCDGIFTLKDSDTIAQYNEGSVIQVTAVFTPTGEDSGNYDTVECQVWLEITEKQITGKPVIQGSPMVSQQLTAHVSSTMDPSSETYYDFQWLADGEVIPGAESSVLDIIDSYKDKKISIRVTAKSGTGYTGMSESEQTAGVIEYLTPATQEVLEFTIPDNCTYDSNEHRATVTLKDEYIGKVGDIQIRYNGSSSAPVDAGTYTVSVAIGVPNLEDGITEGKYGPVSGLVLGSFTISPRDLTVNIVPKDKVYDGRRAAEADVNFDNLLAYDLDNVQIADGYLIRFDTPDVGVDKEVTATGLYLTGSRAFNYTLKVNAGTADVSVRELRATATGITKEYDGSVYVDIDFSNVNNYADVDNSTTVYFINGHGQAENANAGSHRVLNDQIAPIEFELAGSSASNYVGVIDNADSVMVTILAATPSLTIPEIDAGTYNSARPLKSLDLTPFSIDDPATGLKGHWHFKEEDTIPTVSVTRYAATFHSNNSNYSNVDSEIIVHVSPATVTIKADDMTIPYGSAIPTFTATITGLTGEDRIEDISGIGYSFEHTYFPGSDIGDYDINVNCSFDDNNYDFVTEKGILKVTPASLVVTAKAENKDYDGNADIKVDFEITSGLHMNDDVTLTATSTIGTAATPNAGVTTVTYEEPSIMGVKSGNYVLVVTPASGVLEVEIYKIKAENVQFPTEGTVEFGYDLTHATFEFPGSGDGTFEYENAKNTVPGEIGVYSNYYVVFTPTDSRNYESQRQLVTLTVVKCKLDYVVGIAGTAQEGEVLTVAITGMPVRANEYIKYQWYRIDEHGEYELIEDAVETSYTVLASDVGYTIYVVTYFDDTAPYEYADTAAVDTIDNEIIGIIGSTIDAIQAIKLTFWQRLLNWIYRIIAAITGIRIGVTK